MRVNIVDPVGKIRIMKSDFLLELDSYSNYIKWMQELFMITSEETFWS